MVSQTPPPQGHFGSIDERGMKHLFGIPFSKLRDQDFERAALRICGIAMVVGILFPYRTSPTQFSWDAGSKFAAMIWPLIAGVIYMVIGFSPKQVTEKVPRVVLQWAPFVASVLSIGFIGFSIFHIYKLTGASLPWRANLYLWGYPILVFGLMSMLMNPRDIGARILIVVGAGLCFLLGIEWLIDSAFRFSHSLVPGVFGKVHNILQTLVIVVAAASILFVIKPEQVPALKAFDEFAPFITAFLLAWLPLEVLIITLAFLLKSGNALGDLLMGAHMLVVVCSSFGILMLTAPEAYDAAKQAIVGGHQADFPMQGGYPQQGGYPPQGPPQGGYPPPGGGMPPQGGPQGGYPPPGGGMPPQGGGYPPPGQGGGGGWPQQ